MSDTRILQDDDDIRKALWCLKQVSPFAEDNSTIGSIATNVANEVEEMKRKYVCKYSPKGSKKVKTLPTKTSIKLSRKGEATFVSDLLFQRLVFFVNGCDISFDNCMDMNCEYIWINNLNAESWKALTRAINDFVF